MNLIESLCIFWCPRPAIDKVLQHRMDQAEMALYDAMADAIQAKHTVALHQELRDTWRTLVLSRGLTAAVPGPYNPPIIPPDNLESFNGPPSQS